KVSASEEDEEEDEYDRLQVEHAFRRGWLDTLKLNYAHLGVTRALARAPQVRLLRHLEFPHTRSSDSDSPAPAPEPGDGVPANCYYPALYPLAKSAYLGNVRTFIVGEVFEEQEGDPYVEYGPSCHTSAEGAAEVVKLMPRLEELRLLAHRTDTKMLFSLKTL